MGSYLGWRSPPQELETKEQFQELLDSVDTFLFDCDGVLWTADGDAVLGAREAVQFLQSKGKSVYFVTNNSSRSREQYVQKLIRLGFEASKEQVFSTAYIAAIYLKDILKLKGKKVYLLGLPGFADELEAVGIRCIGPGVDHVEGVVADWLKMPLESEVSAVVVGFDKDFSYLKMIKACSYLKDPKCHFIATNEDATLPTHSESITIPGTGCFVKSVKYGAGREPTILGKPCDPMFNVIKERTRLDPARTVMVGDRMSSDIVFGRTHGMKTVLVFTGISKREDLESAPSDHLPDYFTRSVANLLKCSDS